MMRSVSGRGEGGVRWGGEGLEEEEEEDREYSGWWLVQTTDWSNYQPLSGPVKQSMELQFLRLIVSILASDLQICIFSG